MSLSSAQDSRMRSYTFLTTYLVAANILKDDAVTVAPFVVWYDMPRYPLSRVFLGGKDKDVAYSIGTAESKPILDFDGQILGYNEKVPITINCIDKVGVNGEQLRWRAEAELRRAVEANWIGSYRTFNKISVNTQDMGGWKLYSVTYNLTYERDTDPVHASPVKISYGTGFLDDFVKLSANWVETEDGQTIAESISENGFLDINCTVSAANKVGYVSYYNEGGASNLGLSQTVFPLIRFKYKCSNANVKAKAVLVFSDASTQTVMDNTNNTSLTVVQAAITSGKTVDHIRLYCNSATGHVYYDNVQIYQGTFVFPNFRYGFQNTLETRYATNEPWGFSGGNYQNGGSKLMAWSGSSDVTKGVWTRTLPNDKVSCEVLYDIIHNSKTEPWQWLETATHAMKVNITKIDFPTMASTEQMDWRLNIEFQEYRDSNGGCSHETYRSRFNLNES